VEYRFYELSGDLPEALHFRHFEQNGVEPLKITERIRLKSIVASPAAGSVQGRIRLKDETPKTITLGKPAAEKLKLKKNKKEKTNGKSSEPTSTRIRYKDGEQAEQAVRIKSKLGRGNVKVCKI
jgi:hypothetical protein